MSTHDGFCTIVLSLFLASSSIFGGYSSSSLGAQELEPSRPNIILMMADDMGWGSIAAPGFSVRIGLNADETEVRWQGTPHWQTPNLAAMASNGLMFSRMYSQSPVCSPTRASVLTGRHPERLGIPFANEGNMENREITLAEYARTLGYATGIFGKWHLGSMTRDVNDSNRGGPGSFDIYSFPTCNGFDAVYATESKTNTYNPLQLSPTTHYWTAPGVFVPFDAPELLGDDSAIIARETSAFMEQAVNAGEPFLSVVWFHTPHKPVTSPTAARNSLGAYITSMEDLDTAVGEIRAKVQELGIADNTILMFTSDNGPEDDQDWNTTLPLRANKRELFEGGLRVPGLIEWSGKIAPGETHTPMVTTDYLPTLLEIWGIDPADDRPLDGQSMVNTIFNDRQAERERTMIFQSTNSHRSAVGFGGRYKLITVNNGSFWSLYDVVHDFDENAPIATSSNIGTQDQATQNIFNSLLAEFNARNASIGDGLSTSFATDYQARVTSASGIAVGDEPPENLEAGQRQNNIPELFIEQQYATLRDALTMNSNGLAGTYNVTDTAPLPAGTVVHSYLVHHDSAASNTAQFEITFEDRIVGVIGSSDLLAASDTLSFADPNFEGDRGLDENQDNWTISNDGHTISFLSMVNVQPNAPGDAPVDVIEVEESITVMANGTVVPVDATGNIDSSGFTPPAGPRDPTSGLTWEYGIRERSNAQETDRRTYSFLRFDISKLTMDPTDPDFSAIFTVDYQGHLNDSNGGFNAELGQVSGSWDTTTAPSAALSTGSTSLGTLATNIATQQNQITEITLDITALVQGWADGSIANDGLTFTSNENISQGAYFSNATIVTSVEPAPVAELDQVRILTESSVQFVSIGNNESLLGDFDGDDDVDCDDLDAYIGNILAAAAGPLNDLDLDDNGTIELADANTHITTLVETSNDIVGTFLGDLNCDGAVDVLGDAFILIANLGNSVTSYGQGDLNFDGIVDVLGDAFALVANLGMTNEP